MQTLPSLILDGFVIRTPQIAVWLCGLHFPSLYLSPLCISDYLLLEVVEGRVNFSLDISMS